MDVAPLFRPLRINDKELPNRIVMPPMVVLRGLTTPEGIEWYGSRARGVGLVIVEAAPVNRFGSVLTADNLKPLVNTIHDGGALAAIQLFPSYKERETFFRGSSVSPHDVDRNEVEWLPDSDWLAENRASSPNDIDRSEIDRLVAYYRTAAQVCAEAGFDGIEPHGAHGYLLNQFFSPLQNKRTDEYGGGLKNRMRLALRIVEALAQVCGPDMLLLYRHTPVGQGYGVEESLILAEALVAAGVDILDISPASADRPGDRAAPFKGLGVPVIAVNQLDQVERALEVLNEGRADLVAVGRGLIADPEWPIKVREGRFEEIVECDRCDAGCMDNLRRGIPVECVQWE